ncbi:MAG: DUF2384 domain-containing protein [Gammaproteobacteria bacterium]|nr:DUF2384 domain-containing protein [Gammaproteobacteria bacterium]MBU1655126.1 DUF2384 domain-containing protein [Gammaproteobacteria bacterium]MBU1961598.1 DUF2384 domain-containing protein [Gammaproteobacteria bacterium]
MALVGPEKIASVLDITPPPHSFAELDDLVSQGLPKSALEAGVEHVCMDRDGRKQLLHRLVPEATFKRRRNRLTAAESARAERLARIFATAQYVWGSDEDARTFLHAPHSLLQGLTPLDVSLTEIGARRVEELLWRLYHGIAA